MPLPGDDPRNHSILKDAKLEAGDMVLFDANVLHYGPGMKKSEVQERIVSFTLFTPSIPDGEDDPYHYDNQYYMHALYKTLYVNNTEEEYLNKDMQLFIHKMNTEWTLQQNLYLNQSAFFQYYSKKALDKHQKEKKKNIPWYKLWKVLKKPPSTDK
jgi:hypothetical protein